MRIRVAPPVNTGQRTDEMLVLAAGRIRQIAQLLQQERILEDALDRLDEVGFQGGRMLLARIERLQKFLQRLRTFVWTESSDQ